MAPLTDEDRILIRILRAEKGYNAHQMMIEFPFRKWNKYALYRLTKQIDSTGTSNSRNCGRQHSARTAANIVQVEELICSQDSNQGRVRVREKLSMRPEFYAVGLLLGALLNMASTPKSIVDVRFRNCLITIR